MLRLVVYVLYRLLPLTLVGFFGLLYSTTLESGLPTIYFALCLLGIVIILARIEYKNIN